jgi:hypothetical protein
MPSLAEFLAPFDSREFKASYYGKKPLHISAPARLLPNPMPWQRFNQCLDLTSLWDEDTLKVFYRNRLALRDNYCDVSNVGMNQKAAADPRKVKALLGLGASLVANQIQRVSVEVAALVHMLQREFAAAAGANAYCSFQGIQAFNTHYDLHDVFALQTEGEKLWRIYEARADNPIAPLPPGDEAEKWLIATRGKLLAEILMRPGDLLYLPRGQYHDAITGADASLHLTFWVKPATGLSLLKVLESVISSDSAFRADIPDARDAAALSEHLRQLALRLAHHVTTPSFAMEVGNHQRSLATVPASFELPLRQAPRYFSSVKRGQVLRSDTGFTARFDSAEIEVGSAHAAVSWLLQQKLFSLDDLAARFPFVDGSTLAAVLNQLVRVGAVIETDMR